MKFEFYAHSARLLRKRDHVLLVCDSAHSKVLLLRAYLKVIFHETMVFSFILGSNTPNQMPRGIRENFCTPRGAQGEGEYRTPNLGSQREQITGATYLIPI